MQPLRTHVETIKFYLYIFKLLAIRIFVILFLYELHIVLVLRDIQTFIQSIFLTSTKMYGYTENIVLFRTGK